jgi:hypothetical protein
MKSSLDTIFATFNQAPHSSVDSNEVYAVGDDPEQSARRKELIAQYVLNPTEWPDFNYPKLNESELWKSERIMQKVLAELDNLQDAGIEVEVFWEQVALKIAEVYRHLEALRGTRRSGERRDLSHERAALMAIEIFGEPDQAIFDRMLHADVVAANNALNQPNTQQARIGAEFLALIGEGAKRNTSEIVESPYEQLEDETIAILHDDFYQLFPGLEEATTTDKERITPKESMAYFDAALRVIGLSQKGWTVREGEGTAVETHGESKEIVVGQNRTPFTPITLKGVVTHELMHAVHHQNASEQMANVRQRPLPGYLPFAEGSCVAIEQIVTGKKKMSGVTYYLSLGLQLGMDRDDGEKRPPKDTHEIMWRRSLLNKSNMTSEDIPAAQLAAVRPTIRTTRGGSLDARDISYAEGARRANHWFNEVARQEPAERLRLLRWMLSGNFDPTNPDHVAIFTDNEQSE